MHTDSKQETVTGGPAFTAEIEALADLLIDHEEDFAPKTLRSIGETLMMLLHEQMRQEGQKDRLYVTSQEALRAEFIVAYDLANTGLCDSRAGLTKVRNVPMPEVLRSYLLPLPSAFPQLIGERMRLKHDTLYSHVGRIIAPLPLHGA